MAYTVFILLVSLSISNVLADDIAPGIPPEGRPGSKQKIVETKKEKNDNISPHMIISVDKSKDEPNKDEHKQSINEIKPEIDENVSNHKKGASGSVKKQLKVMPSEDVKKPIQNSSTVNSVEENSNIDSPKSQNIESGAVIRGVLVFVGIGMLFMVYVGCKTYRRRKSNVTIRKYGVRGRRSDVEMTPLPLNEDEEDETLFDVGSLNRT